MTKASVTKIEDKTDYVKVKVEVQSWVKKNRMTLTRRGDDDTPFATIVNSKYLEVGCRVPLLGVDEVGEEQRVPEVSIAR